jgi:putative ABC transport system permease protein
VAAYAPVIEQVAQLGSSTRPVTALLLGVDLLGDRRMREYGFEGEDDDVEDPLAFLAQSDSIALTRTLADRARLKKGDRVELRVGPSSRLMTVRALLQSGGMAGAFGGNLIVTDIYAAQDLCGRGRQFDRIDVRLASGVHANDAAAELRKSLGPAYSVDTPERRGQEMDRLMAAFAGGFEVSSLLALAMGVLVIFNAVVVAVDRRRRDIGILRAVGATPRQVQVLFLLEATALGLVGAVLGLAAGRLLVWWLLGLMGGALSASYGLDAVAPASIDPSVAAIALALGGLASFVGAWVPARAAARVSPAEALAAGVFRRREPVRSRRAHVAGAVLLFVCSGLAASRAASTETQLILLLVTGTGAIVLLADPFAGRLVRAAAPLVRWAAPVAGPVAADALLSQPRRTANTTATVALALAFVLGAGGYLHATTTAFNRWVDKAITADLMVRASLRLAPSGQRLPPALRDEILKEPSVDQAAAYRSDWVTFRGELAVLVSIDVSSQMARTEPELVRGTRSEMLRGLVERQQCAISDNFARRYGIDVGDIVDLPTPSGILHLPVAAIVRSFVSDRGAVFIDRQMFNARWRDERVDGYEVVLKPGADPDWTREALTARVATVAPALVSTRQEFVAQVRNTLEGFYALTRLAIWMALVVAFTGIATSLLISVVDRSRDIGVMRAIGAGRIQIGGAVVLEALGIAGCALAIAIPIGELLARFLETTVAERYSGFQMPHAYPVALLLQMVVALPVIAAIAAWLPARQAVRLNPVETLSCE